MLDPEDLLQRLKGNAHPRVQKTLDTLHEILSDYFDKKGKDYSVTTIGRISEKKGGPKYASIRATRNQHYRDLIAAWAEKAGTTMAKPSLAKDKYAIPTDLELVKKIHDPALRAVFGQVLAERARLRREVSLLKQETDFIVDMRPQKVEPPRGAGKTGDRSLSGIISDNEANALRTAISKEHLEEVGLTLKVRTGQVVGEYGEVFPRGFASGIKKLLDAVERC